MGFSALETLLVTERHRQRAGMGGEFAVPVMFERDCEKNAGPFMVTNTKGVFVTTRPLPNGKVRYGMTPCQTTEEDRILTHLHTVLPIRCPSIQDATADLRMNGMEAKSVIVSLSLAVSVCGITEEEATKAMESRGFAAEVTGLRVLLAALPLGTAIVAADPALVGVYTRVGDHLGVLLQRADRAIVAVHGLAR